MVQNETEAKRRGRPRAYDPDDALRRARDVFWVKGYAATSLDDLAAATGMNRPSLYAAFGDKQGIYLAALRAQAEDLAAAIALATSQGGPPAIMVRLIFDRSIDAYLSGGGRGCFLVGTALTEAGANEEVRMIVREAFQRCDDILERRFHAAVAAGEMAADAHPRALAQLVSATMHELSMLARAGHPRPVLEERAALALTLMRL
ncbi:MAG: TetR/AcrR family transcriptional regulator [Hyphomonadaceae bacterium]|nr:MAG: transcriptional regulator TetR family [Caulobacteraceae bacterium]MBT9444605.1 TetR/AcrR family transcriptional regulator [Hyphomonadaceae bacterium]TPW04512.1 MAG: transcriptional regulator, TetR family [Alphaproteobacteria bacterium]